MPELIGNTNLEVNLAGRTTGNPLVGRQGLDVDFSGKSNLHANLVGKFGEGFVKSIWHSDAKAMEFDGTGEHIDCGLDYHTTTCFSCSFWVKRLSAVPNDNTGIVGNGKWRNGGFEIGIGTTHRVRANTNSDTTEYVWNSHTAAGNIPLNEWLHITLAYNSNINEWKLYFDGNIIHTYSNALITVGTRPFRIGRGSQWFFSGLSIIIANVSIWNKALTDSQVKSIMNAKLDGDEDGLIGYWPLDNIFDDNGTLKTEDKTSNNNHGVVHGNPSLVDLF